MVEQLKQVLGFCEELVAADGGCDRAGSPCDHGAAAARTLEAEAEAPRREGWEHARTAVMMQLLHAKYDQNPELAEVLLVTEDATVIYDDMNSAFWGDNAGRGRNWSGRLLELVRSELQARRRGIPGV
jgi:predicted NAD-dependent protein-ADP-ribosyltransferase YbiA (DUF1768 family)